MDENNENTFDASCPFLPTIASRDSIVTRYIDRRFLSSQFFSHRSNETMKRFACYYVSLALLLATASARSAETNPTSNSINEQQTARSNGNGMFGELRYVYQVYKECAGAELSPCLKLKLLSAMDRVSRSAQLNVADGVTLVQDESTANESEPERSLQEIEAGLPRALEDKEDALNGMIFDRIVKFFQSHTLKLRLPNVEELQRSFAEEGEKGKIASREVPID